MADSTSSNDAADPVEAGDGGNASIFGPIHLTRALILLMAILCAVVFYFAAHWLPWPAEPGFRGSMGQPKVALGGFVVAIALLAVLTLVSTFLIGRRWFLAGLLAATAGLTTWAVRGGTMPYVLFNAENTGANQVVFLQMLGELIVFYAVIGALWNLIWNTADAWENPDAATILPGINSQAERVRKTVFVAMFGVAGYIWWANSQKARYTPRDDEGRSTPAGLLAQVGVMVILMLIFVVTPMKKQVLTSVFLSGMISTAVAEYFFADRKAGRWYWIGPLIVGAFGYLAGYFSPIGIETGDLQGLLAPLTRVLPIDYASMGCAGVLVGYWWMEPDAEVELPLAEIAPPTTETPTGATPTDPT